jgi:ElaB/YqjD/DUF883 family membrane-anchored ribosome-binding protein
MPLRQSLHDEIAALTREIEALKPAAAAPATAEAEGVAMAPSELERQIHELTRLVETMLDEAEDTVTRHPVATVAGALALGIVIGRLTAR